MAHPIVPRPSAPSALVLLLSVFGCSSEPKDTSPGALPPPESPPTGTLDSPDTWTFGETGTTTLSESPAHTLTIVQRGAWTLSPPGGPYTSMTGTLTVDEYLDSPAPDPDDTSPPRDSTDTGLLPTCAVSYALTGLAAEEPCTDCYASFDVLHYVISGDVGACHDPELPEHETTWPLGYRLDYRGTEDWVLRSWSGVAWLPWYPATRVGDAVTFDWTVVVGVAVEEEEE